MGKKKRIKGSKKKNPYLVSWGRGSSTIETAVERLMKELKKRVCGVKERNFKVWSHRLPTKERRCQGSGTSKKGGRCF